MMKYLSSFLSLPSMEQRKVPFWFARYCVGENAAYKQSDDTFIYYAIARTSFLVALFLSLLNLISHFGNFPISLYFFEIDITKPNFVDTFTLEYPKYTAIILLFLVLPYYVAIFRKYINPKTFDLFWKNPPPPAMPPQQLVRGSVFYIVALVVMMYRAAYVFRLLFKAPFLLSSSPIYLVFICFVVPFIEALGNYMILTLIMIVWRYLGKTDSNSVGETKQISNGDLDD